MRIRGAANLEFLIENFDYNKCKPFDPFNPQEQEKQGFVFEGGSGSAKTYDIIHFLLLYCQHFKDEGKDILIFRQTLADLKKTVYKDFIKVLRMYGLYDEKYHTMSSPICYELYGNKIYFSGLDTMGAHGERHDIIWGNEGMELDKDAFKQLNQRCNEAFIIDYNPSATDHWIFDDIIPRKDTKFFKSTQLQNPFLPPGQRSEILKYEPTPENIAQGTADDYLWNVYGLGIRSAPEGLIFQHVTWIDTFPTNIEKIYYGMDFGFTNDPSAIARIGIDGRNLYAECLWYEQTISEAAVIEAVKSCVPANKIVWADSSEPGMIAACQRARLKVHSVNKFAGSIDYGISLEKKYKIHYVKSTAVQKEQANYKYRTVNGKRTNDPVDAYNHWHDAKRYALISSMAKR